jgi:poly-gamma-glutamate capsule biosynthesis protein CapA/YwtB (metallophosphatase superfamily)
MRIKIALVITTIAITTSLLSNPSFAATKSKSSNIVINFVGDVHGESAVNRASLSSLKKYFVHADLNIFNLETAVTDINVKQEKQYNFKTDLTFLKSLRNIGFNLANIANNHSYDYGVKGFEETLKNLDAVGIDYVGGGINSSAAYQGKVYRIKGVRIGVLGIAKVNGGPDSIATKIKAGTTNGYDATSTEEAIKRVKAVSDVVIVITHWGEEGSFCPRPSEISSAKKWSDLGADIVLGSHTHTLQPITLQSNKLVAYSMGNFIFYSLKPENRSTGLLKIEISQKKKISYTLVPFTINNVTKVPEKNTAIPATAVSCKN